MQRPWLHLATISLLLVSLVIGAAPKDDRAKGVLGVLARGQKVAIKDHGNVYEISILAGVDLGHTISEVGPDYLVVQDIAGVTDLRIPLYSIKAVKIMNLPKR